MIEVRRTFDPERRSKGILRTPNSALDAMLRIFTPAFFAVRQRQKCKPESRASRSFGAPRRLCNANVANIAAGKR